jgi:hypothetical protein
MFFRRTGIVIEPFTVEQAYLGAKPSTTSARAAMRPD